MSNISELEWDSNQLGISVGKINNVIDIPTSNELEKTQLVLARVPISNNKLFISYKNVGFDYIATDFKMSLSKIEKENSCKKKIKEIDFRHIKKEKIDFLIDGFNIEHSRLMLDDRVKNKLPNNYWDKVITNHCETFADGAIALIKKKNNNLIAVLSYLKKNKKLNINIVSVHPDYLNKGIGSIMMEYIKNIALSNDMTLKTEVLSSNILAINFYFKHDFKIIDGDFILHKWNAE